MKKALDVYLHTFLIGHIIQNEEGQVLFEYSQGWLDNPAAVPLSQSLPLRKEIFGQKYCRPFFAGALPDETKRKIIAGNLGISANNDFAMLEQIGGECAGAVTFIHTGDALPTANNDYRALSETELAKILKELPRRPLMAGEDGVRLSLAGAQDKIAVAVRGNEMLLPLHNAPSSHIVKPAIAGYDGMVFNEAFCMKLAKAAGLPVATVEIGKAEDVDYLRVERYDRVHRIDGGQSRWERLHQEDFCQALGVIPEWRYQVEGGPSFTQCFDLVRETSTVPAVDLLNLLDAAIFNFLIGNHDAHGKNFSLLYKVYDATRENPLLGEASEVRLAPLYDLVCTPVYPALSNKMAMKLGGTYEIPEVDVKQMEKFAQDIKFAKPLVKQRVAERAELILGKLNEIDVDHPIVGSIRKFIGRHCESALKTFSNKV